MQTFYNNPDWAFIINFSSIFLAVLSILMTIKFTFEKELGLITWETTTISESIPENSDPKIKSHNLYLAFQNFGKSVIYKTDLLNGIRIELLRPVKIKHISIESTCKFNTINYEIKNENILFFFDFLEGKKYFKINLKYYSEEVIDAKVVAKIIGGNEIDTDVNKNTTWENSYRIGTKDARAKIFVFPFLSLVLASLSLQGYIRMFNSNYPAFLEMLKKFDKNSFETIFIGLIIIFSCIMLSRYITKAFVPFASHMKKEKNWYSKK